MSMARMTVTLPEELAEAIRVRHGEHSSFSAQIANDLGCYYQLIQAGMNNVKQNLSDQDLDLIREATADFTWKPRMVPSLIRRALFTFIDDFIKFQERDRSEFAETLEKYEKLGEIGRLALIDWLAINPSTPAPATGATEQQSGTETGQKSEVKKTSRKAK